ncbi:ATP-dependent metallopeptidase FtsH/Yme1/Tma family protein [Haloimpatiens lingqiaonensis]|uniref:ATP-dependent metallopeptidase FtsH/Yme1/Tma family protein n=1 Tax=Haloimpatiens lingqiaonensis TaxID=1380675 RepID=UPI0010FF5D76|nr:FtsH/Yme1/Tma family ATP-dependent metallopeptidase [Haloimpatiens lingqiaonensis]
MDKNKKKLLFLPAILGILSLTCLIYFKLPFNNTSEKSYIEFMKDVSQNKVESIYDTTSPVISVKLKDGKVYKTDNPRKEDFKEQLLKLGIKVKEESLVDLRFLLPSLGLLFSAGAVGVTLLNMNKTGKKGLFSVSSIDTEAVKEMPFDFNSVAGNEEAKESLKDIVDFLKSPEKYKKYGARIPKGIILYGDPGTGKTLLAKAIAGEAEVPFFPVSGSDFVQVYVGVGAGRIRSLFKKAKSHGKAVIFIDEIDAIGKKRSDSNSGGADERDQTLNALLTQMSGFQEDEGIVVIAATNRLDILDEALLRPGRFDRHIEVSLPDVSAREKILNLHLKNKPCKNINIKEWAKKTAYFSGAKLESLVNEAAILACKDNSINIEDLHMDRAYSIVLAGYEKINRDFIKEKDRNITAYHEIGHALTSMYVLPEEKVSKVTIIPSTKGAGGYTLSIPADNMYQSKDYLYKRIMVALGGRAAEEIIFGKAHITTGAYNDLQKCTEIAFNMVTQYGMGKKFGLLSLNNISPNGETTNEILAECRDLVDSLYEKTKDLLMENKEELCELSKLLIEKETLYYEDLN